VAALARLLQLEHRAARHHLATVGDERFQQLLQVQHARLVVHQRDHVHAEGVLQLGLLEKVVQHHFGQLAALQFDHHADALLVGFVADVRNALEPFLGHLFGDALEQRLLVHLVRQFVDHDHLAVVLARDVLEMGARAHHHAAASRTVALVDSGDAVDDSRGRKIGRRHQLDQFLDRAARRLQYVQAGIHHL